MNYAAPEPAYPAPEPRRRPGGLLLVLILLGLILFGASRCDALVGTRLLVATAVGAAVLSRRAPGRAGRGQR